MSTTKDAAEAVQQVTDYLEGSELAPFGAVIRPTASAYFAVHTLPASAWSTHAEAAAYLIGWVFALDEVMDTCPSLSYAEDLLTLLKCWLVLPQVLPQDYPDLGLAHDPLTTVPGLDYSLADLAATIQPLRQRIASRDEAWGAALFDAQLWRAGRAMRQETAWRLAHVQPSYAEYIQVGRTSICGDLCTAALVAALPDPTSLWGATAAARDLLGVILRLYNDRATWGKDEGEGKPNALLLLAGNQSRSAAEQEVAAKLANYNEQLTSLCGASGGRSEDNPLGLLHYYILACAEVTKQMYSRGDFVAQENQL